MDCKPFSTSCGETSRTVTWHPAFAATCAIPDPISPHPTTPTFSIAIYSSRIISSDIYAAKPYGAHFFANPNLASRSEVSSGGNELCRQPRRLAPRVHLCKNFLRDMKRGIRRRHSAIDCSLKQDFLNFLARHIIVRRRANVHPKLIVAI